MSGALGQVVLLLAVVWLVSVLAKRVGAMEPIVLVVTGFVLSWIPGIPTYTLDPHVALSFFLPPLLYAAALTTSVPAFRANLRPIGFLAVGLVLFTAAVVGLVAHAVVPGLSLAAAFTLGAVVAPPDAVAASAVARRTGLPRRVIAVLEGESLLNDATALVSFRVASAAAVSGAFSVWTAGAEFLWASVGGVALGVAVALGDGVLRRVTRPDAVLDNALSLITPFFAYFLGELVHASGVLAVVVAGLYLGHRAPSERSAASRLQTRAAWLMIEFLLQGVVFLLIGLQLRSIVEGLPDMALSRLAWVSLAVVLAVLLSRPLWVFPVAYLARLLPFVDEDRGSWRAPAVVSWAGMRGVVSLAVALALPTDFPQRELVLFLTLVVIVATLVVQGLTLSWFIGKVRLAGPDPVVDILAEASAREEAYAASLRRLDELEAQAPGPEAVVRRLRASAESRSNVAWERLGSSGSRETPSAAYRRLRIAMLEAERSVFVGLRDRGTLPEDLMSSMVLDLDLEEALLTQDGDADDRSSVDRAASPMGVDEPVPTTPPEEDSVTPMPGCQHTAALPEQVEPSGEGCGRCLALGRQDWVHLRLCLTCGEVGCCDSSPLRHATAHYDQAEHPVMRSFEPGESWRWCYVDEGLV